MGREMEGNQYKEIRSKGSYASVKKTKGERCVLNISLKSSYNEVNIDVVPTLLAEDTDQV